MLVAGYAISVRSADLSCVAEIIPQESVTDTTNKLEIARFKYASPKHAMLEQARNAEHIGELDMLAHVAFKYCW
ncbi:hypothetical protein [Ruegeria atlantica]|uniref:hypothetical protein n=1 Tax=Ruegeria atlantica TaxID=81569 RepID=UPI00071E0EC0|nr:hypothetical protein [Ruegeria atlantica]